MNTNERPISESYWVEKGCFLAGEYPGRFDAEQSRKRLDALIQAGFDTFIDLTQENETVPYAPILQEEAKVYDVDVQYQRFAIGDFGLPTAEQMRAILDHIDSSLQAGRKIYLHCWGGIGRTGTTVGCYLVRRGLSGNEALRQLASWWRTVPKGSFHPHSPETFEQMTFILHWEDYENSPQ